MIEPIHVLLALLSQDTSTSSLLQRAGQYSRLEAALKVALERLPQVSGGSVQIGRELLASAEYGRERRCKYGD